MLIVLCLLNLAFESLEFTLFLSGNESPLIGAVYEMIPSVTERSALFVIRKLVPTSNIEPKDN